MNIEDADIAHAERESDPVRWNSFSSADGLEREYTELHERERAAQQQHHHEQPIEEAEEPTQRTHTHGSISSSSVSSVSANGDSIRPGGARQRPRPSHTDSRLTTTTTNYNLEATMMDYLDRHPTAIKRIEDHRLQHTLTVGSRKRRASDGTVLPTFGGGKPYPPPLPEREEYVVEFDSHDDPRHAQNWPLKRKIVISLILVLDSLAATLASSVFSAASTSVGEQFHVGREVTVLGTSLFVLGYALGPIIFAPMSELYGRRVPIIIAAFGFGVFNTAVAVAKDYQTLMICRFFAGLFGSCPLTVVAAVFSDMFNNEWRGVAVACFSATIINGPLTGPMIGGFITKSYLGWRWTAYIPALMGYASCILAFFFQEESYGPVILVSKASELRRLTRNWGIHAKQEEVEVDLKELITKNVSRPIRILFTEPIVLLVTIYMSFIYGILYLSLTAYALVFGQVYGFAPGVSGLPYIGMIVGVFIGFFVVIALNSNYVKKLKANDNIPVPEWRMPLVMPGGISFAIGLFWLGWTGYTGNVPWIVPTLSGLCLGFGVYIVFMQCLNYIIDAYLMFAASAIAANTIMRSLFGAIFPLFATYMFEGIGINYGMTLLGCVAALFIPMPFLFYFYGKRIRAKSKFAPAPDIARDKRRDEESRGQDDQAVVDGKGSNGGASANRTPSDSEKKD